MLSLFILFLKSFLSRLRWNAPSIPLDNPDCFRPASKRIPAEKCDACVRGHEAVNEDFECGLIPLMLTLKDDGTLGMPLGKRSYPPIRWGDVAIGTTVRFSALRVGLSPGEMADWVTGFFGIDLARDDTE